MIKTPRVYFLNLLIIFFGIFVLYSLVFNINLIENDHFICTEVEEFEKRIFNNEVSYSFPKSCDQDYYYQGFINPRSIIETNHPYQTRPLYVSSVFAISKILDIFLNIDEIPLTQISAIINHSLILLISIVLIKKALGVEESNIKKEILLTLLLLNPIMKWGIFLPSNQTNSFLVISLLFYILKKVQSINPLLTSFILGFLILIYRPFALCFVAITFYIIKEKQSLFSKLQKVINNLILFLIPWYLYQSLIRFLGYTPHDDLANTWGQFRWLANYFIRPVNFLSDKIMGQPVLDKKNYSGGWHCAELPDNFICYFVDNMYSFIYMGIPIIITTIFIKKVSPIETDILNKVIAIFLLVYSFFSLIGWYPPLRFTLYSLANTYFLIIAILILKNDLNIESFFHFIGIGLYFFGLNHWNAPSIVIVNFFMILGLILSFISLYDLEKLTKKFVSQRID